MKNTPMTPERAANLNSERTQGEWKIANSYKRDDTDHPFYGSDLDVKSASNEYVCEVQVKLDDKTHSHISNAAFIANAPAVYDAYIELSAHHKETVRCMSLVLQEVADVVGVKEGDAEGLVNAVTKMAKVQDQYMEKAVDYVNSYSIRPIYNGPDTEPSINEMDMLIDNAWKTKVRFNEQSELMKQLVDALPDIVFLMENKDDKECEKVKKICMSLLKKAGSL